MMLIIVIIYKYHKKYHIYKLSVNCNTWLKWMVLAKYQNNLLSAILCAEYWAAFTAIK